MTSVILDGVSKSFGRNAGIGKQVLVDCSWQFHQDRFTTMVGPNGSGKSTLLSLVSGTAAPDSGSVNVPTNGKSSFRVGYVWQDYRASLLPWMTVAENIAFPLRIQGWSRRARLDRAREALASLSRSIPPDEPVYTLSGGQQQLVCLLRSMVAEPDVLLLDEPLSALDQSTRWSMTFRIEEIWLGHPVPTIFVSHDVDEAVLLADEVVLLSKVHRRIVGAVKNPLPRPRSAEMLKSPEHVRARDTVIDFLLAEGAIRDTAIGGRHSRPQDRSSPHGQERVGDPIA